MALCGKVNNVCVWKVQRCFPRCAHGKIIFWYEIAIAICRASCHLRFLQYNCHPPGRDVCYFILRRLQACPIILSCASVCIWSISSACLACSYITLVPLELSHGLLCLWEIQCSGVVRIVYVHSCTILLMVVLHQLKFECNNNRIVRD